MKNRSKMEIERLAQQYEKSSPSEIISFVGRQFKNTAISFSGAEDVVLIDMAEKAGIQIKAFFLDTGRLHQETYRFVEEIREKYSIDITLFFPDFRDIEKLVNEKGLFSFYKDSHIECCRIRKVNPLKRALTGLDAWITGQRRDQNPQTRNALPVIQIDPVFGSGNLVKINPVASWRSKEVWDYIRDNHVPYNRLHEQGYASIGCAPCTKPVLPSQNEREGRWWWENADKKECGLHAGNLNLEKF